VAGNQTVWSHGGEERLDGLACSGDGLGAPRMEGAPAGDGRGIGRLTGHHLP
jgi:hypothetical protein